MSYPCVSVSLAILHITPRFILHLPVIGSGGASVMYGASSKNVTFKLNFSGTPCGGVWLSPGQTMSLMYSPSRSQDFQTPIYTYTNAYNNTLRCCFYVSPIYLFGMIVREKHSSWCTDGLNFFLSFWWWGGGRKKRTRNTLYSIVMWKRCGYSRRDSFKNLFCDSLKLFSSLRYY